MSLSSVIAASIGGLALLVLVLIGRAILRSPAPRHSEDHRRLELVLSGADLGYWDWDIPSGRVSRNERWAHMLGRTLDDVPPRLEGWEALLHPDDHDRVLESVRRLGDGSLPRFNVEYRLRHASGDWRWVLDSGSVVERDAAGRPTRAAGVQGDITGRKRMQEELLDTTAFLQRIVDTSPSMIFVVDAQGRLVFANQYAARYYGTTPEELVSRATGDVHLEIREAQAFVTDDLEVIRTGRTLVRNEPNTAPDGTRHWFHTVKVPLVRPDGSVACLGIATDITERKRAEEALVQAQTLAAMGSMVAGVAHEVRNPLFAISSTLDAFEARFGAREEFQRPLTALRREVDRLGNLMNELLELAKPAPSTRPEAMGPIVEEAVQVCASLSGEAGVSVVPELQPNLPPVAAERSRLVQVLQNLIANAVQHSKPGGVVTVRVRRATRNRKPVVECTVADEGPGFLPEDLSRVFEPFFSRRPRGTGLGLAIVRRIVDQHGGDVQAGNGDGGGAFVRVRLPLDSA